MSRKACSNCSGRATAGSYSTSACSCVRLTATLSTPGIRPSAFSIVPVQSEQWRPPIRARIFRRSGLADGSSLQGSNGEIVAVEAVIGNSGSCCQDERDASRSLQLFAPYDPKAGLLDRVNEVLFIDRLRIEEQ